MADPPRGRGRARGRGIELVPAQPLLGPPAPLVAPIPAPSVGVVQSTQRPIGRSRGGPSAAAKVQELTKKTAGLSVSSAGDNGNGNGNGNNPPIGRGSVRSGRQLTQMLNTRPEYLESKKGNTGQSKLMQVNYFKLVNSKQWVIYKHHVDFNPVEDRTFVKRMLLREHSARFGGHLFDGSTLFAIQPVCDERKPLELISVRRSDEAKIKITIKRVGICESSDYQILQIFNIILRNCLGSLNLKEIRRNYYDPEAKISLPLFNLELWPGYISNINRYENDILILAEINYKVLRTDTAYHLFRHTLNQVGNKNIKRKYSTLVIGNIVLTTYNSKTYRIDDVDYSSTPESTFPKRTKEGNQDIKYSDYFRDRYGVSIKDRGQPMLVSRSSAKDRRAGQAELVYLIPELCVMTGLTDEMRSNFLLMKATTKHTAVGPADRVRRIINYGKRLINEPTVKDTLKQWGMDLRPELVTVQARNLPSEIIVVGDGKTHGTGPQVDWTKNLRENKFLHPVSCNNWLMVFPSRNKNDAESLFSELIRVGRPMGFNMAAPVQVELQSDSVGLYIQDTVRAINNNNPELVLFLFPNNRSDRYAAVKKLCIVEKPVPSQVVLLRSVNNKNFTSIATKIAIQINCKLGGAPWTLSIPLKGLMIVGYDVCHDPRDKRKSYGALVATTDATFARYFSVVKHHPSGEELSLNFGLNLAMAAKRYAEVNKSLPEKIIVYRDGVGEGSLAYVKEQEVGNIRKELSKLYAGNTYQFQLTFVVVTKRINTRLFDNGQNPSPGTVVDDVVTNPLSWDFFLVSQSVKQGTVTPTHYNIIADGTRLSPDIMQKLTYRLTHMYYNWSGTVRVPAPCQYAHKLAFLTSQSVGQEHSHLKNLLYFL